MSRRTLLAVGLGLVIGQAVLALGYLIVESVRDTAAPFAWEPLDEAAPAMLVEHAGRPVLPPEGAHLVHFWATWCAPCVAELPSLLAAAEAEGVPLLAVTDEPWPTVQAWFDGQVPSAVVRDPAGDATKTWRVSVLPDSFVVVEGRITARTGGARDWSSRDARRFLREVER
jgi:hypothetical protein